MRIRWGQSFLVVLLVWLAVMLYLLVPLWKSTETEERLIQAQREIARLSSENANLRELLKSLQKQLPGEAKDSVDLNPESLNQAVLAAVDGPSKEYELVRRKIGRNVNEFWRFVAARLEQGAKLAVSGNMNDVSLLLNQSVAQVSLYHKVLLSNLDELGQVDGYAEWRLTESRQLSALVQKRLHSLQNPQHCDQANKLVCNLNKGCGFGCQIHHAVYCLIVAYGTERTLVLKSKGWRYDKKGFEDVFRPLSDTCAQTPGKGSSYWKGSSKDQIVDLPIIDSVNPRPVFLPPAIPRDLSDRIIRIHGDPIVWWIAEFLRYILRLQPSTQKLLAETKAAMGFDSPIVGIHVRRTDKVGTEAAYHSVEEYMKHVSEYYALLEVKAGRPLDKKRVFVASDDVKVLEECRRKFPDYEFLGDSSVAKSAAVSSRYSLTSLRGVIIDIHLLSECDYLVCTFSSQVCRLAYEIMQQRFVDAADRFRSLDDIWYFGGQDEHQQIAIMDHQPLTKEEVQLKTGDVIGVAGNHWNGFNNGRNHRTGRVGLYPEYKTRENLRIVDFPSYTGVKL